jgi:hypothetical protein
VNESKEKLELKESIDVVLEEIWAAKDKIAAECDYDVDKLFERARARQKKSGRPSVNLQGQRQSQPQKP